MRRPTRVAPTGVQDNGTRDDSTGRRLGWALIALLSLPAAAADPPPTLQLDAQDSAALAGLGDDVIVKALPALPIDDPIRYFPLREAEWTYLVAHGEGLGSRKSYRLAAKATRTTETVWEWELADEETLYLKIEDDGSIGVSSQIDNQQNVITTFAPPEQILDKTLRPGQPQKRKVDVEVFDLHNPSKKKYSGDLVATDTYVGAFQVKTPAGTYDTILMRTGYQGKVGPAKVNDTSYRFFAADVGVVAMVTQSKITAALIYRKNSKRSLVLVDGPLGGN